MFKLKYSFSVNLNQIKAQLKKKKKNLKAQRISKAQLNNRKY